MTQSQLDSQIARITGEPLSKIHVAGLQPRARTSRGPRARSLKLVLDCPFCGYARCLSGVGRRWRESLAECDRCDLYFDFSP